MELETGTGIGQSLEDWEAAQAVAPLPVRVQRAILGARRRAWAAARRIGQPDLASLFKLEEVVPALIIEEVWRRHCFLGGLIPATPTS